MRSRSNSTTTTKQQSLRAVLREAARAVGANEALTDSFPQPMTEADICAAAQSIYLALANRLEAIIASLRKIPAELPLDPQHELMMNGCVDPSRLFEAYRTAEAMADPGSELPEEIEYLRKVWGPESEEQRSAHAVEAAQQKYLAMARVLEGFKATCRTISEELPEEPASDDMCNGEIPESVLYYVRGDAIEYGRTDREDEELTQLIRLLKWVGSMTAESLELEWKERRSDA